MSCHESYLLIQHQLQKNSTTCRTQSHRLVLRSFTCNQSLCPIHQIAHKLNIVHILAHSKLLLFLADWYALISTLYARQEQSLTYSGMSQLPCFGPGYVDRSFREYWQATGIIAHLAVRLSRTTDTSGTQKFALTPEANVLNSGVWLRCWRRLDIFPRRLLRPDSAKENNLPHKRLEPSPPTPIAVQTPCLFCFSRFGRTLVMCL